MSVLVERMPVKHATGALEMDVTYTVTDKIGGRYGDGSTVIDLISAQSPITGHDFLPWLDGKSTLGIKLYLSDLEARKAVAA